MEIKYAQGEELEKGWILSLSMLRDVREKMREINNDGTTIPTLAQTELLLVALKLIEDEKSDDEGDSDVLTMYTCNDGLYLFRNNILFSAWVKNSPPYKKAKKNIKIKVDASDVVIHDGMYRVVDLKSVKIIG